MRPNYQNLCLKGSHSSEYLCLSAAGKFHSSSLMTVIKYSLKKFTRLLVLLNLLKLSSFNAEIQHFLVKIDLVWKHLNYFEVKEYLNSQKVFNFFFPGSEHHKQGIYSYLPKLFWPILTDEFDSTNCVLAQSSNFSSGHLKPRIKTFTSVLHDVDQYFCLKVKLVCRNCLSVFLKVS